ncbi:CSN-associated deubiquitinating enzyme Ubp12, partial [Ceratobasidium sp. 428]
MDAALIQCLAYIPELNQYFRSGLYRHELNPDNPLGTEGLFATTFSALLHYLHLSGGTPNPSVTKPVNGGRENSSVSYAPRGFKQALTRLAPALLSGLQQHDTQELLDFLLNELHGDLNRVLEEPDIETPEWPETCGGRDAETRLAKETWKVYRQRNDSIIVDLFQGMYKSTLVCPECARVSITFNPFMHLTLPLPLPIPETWRHTVYYVPWDLNKATLAVQIEVPKDSSYGYLKKLFGRWFNVDPENLLAAEVWAHKFYKFYDDHVNLTQLAEKDVLVVYELPIPFKSGAKLPPPNGDFSKTFSPPSLSTFSQCTLDSAPFILPVFYTTNQRGISSVFGVPFILVLTAAEACSREAIYRAVVERCGRWTRLRADLWCRPPLIKVTDALVCQWPSTMSDYFFSAENSLFDQWEAYVHPEVEALRAAKSKLRSGRQTVDIEDCLSEFTREQQLNENNLWHCPGCRKHQQATKKVELWSTPDILVIHLKRPSNTCEVQDKVDALVDFPVEGLDLGQRVGMRGAEGEGGEEGKYVYDLFALGEHTGGSTSEDYRAYAKNFSDGEWYCFNDDSINKLSTEGFVNAIAHFLFYRRRAAIPGAVIDKVQSRNENSSANNSKSKPMAEIIAEPQNIPQPPNRIDVKPRDELSSLATNGYACLVTHSRTLLDCVHVMARATDAKI